MRKRLALNVYLLVCNIPICFFLALAAAIAGVGSCDNGIVVVNFNNLNWLNITYNFLIGLLIALIVGNFVPFVALGKWFAGLFHVRNDVIEGNMPYRLLKTVIVCLIYYISISPILTLFNWAIGVYKSGQEAGIGFLINMPIMLIVGYIVALISDYFAYKVGKKVDPSL